MDSAAMHQPLYHSTDNQENWYWGMKNIKIFAVGTVGSALDILDN